MSRAASLAVLLPVVLAGCSAPYSPGALLSGPAAPLAASFGCLELSARPEGIYHPFNVLLAFSMGNRCYQPTCFDLSQVRAIVHDADGERSELKAHDPRQELRRACLDGHAQVTERIVYVARQSVASTAPTVCLDYSRLEATGRRTVRCFRCDAAGCIARGEP